MLLSRGDCLVWGCGVSNCLYLVQDLGETQVPHNLYVEYFVQFGVIGIALLCVVLKEPLKNIFKSFNSYMMVFLFAFAVTSLGISANANDTVFLVLLTGCISFNQKNHRVVKALKND